MNDFVTFPSAGPNYGAVAVNRNHVSAVLYLSDAKFNTLVDAGGVIAGRTKDEVTELGMLGGSSLLVLGSLAEVEDKLNKARRSWWPW